MSTGEHMTYFLKKDSYIPSYAVFPRYLFRMEISETAKLIYILLLDRARLSMKNEGWVNESGHMFIYYTIEELAKDCGKSQMTVKNSLTALERAGLIYRQRQGYGLPNRLFVRYGQKMKPQDRQNLKHPDRQLSGQAQTENCPQAIRIERKIHNLFEKPIWLR